MLGGSAARRRVRRGFVALIAAAALLVTPSLQEAAEAASPTPKERRMHRIINRVRANHGLPTLRLHKRLTRKAHRHSRAMARQRRVYHHSCLSCLPPGSSWSSVGENVGRGAGLKAVHRLFMRSATHRANILCGCYRAVGVGVVRKGGRVYVTEIFLG